MKEAQKTTKELVICIECEYWNAEIPERCKAMNARQYGWCCRKHNSQNWYDNVSWNDITDFDDFCSRGKRRSDDEN